MSKELIVAQALSAIQAGQSQVLNDQLGLVYDEALAEAPPSGGFSQADIDAAVAAAQAVDAKALSDAQGVFQVALDAANKALEDMTAKEQLEEQAVQDVALKIQSVQAAFDQIKALLAP